MTCTDTTELVNDYFDLARAKAKTLARELRERGVPVDFDELESDATYFLLKCAGKWSAAVSNKTAGYFVKALDRWAECKRLKVSRDFGRNREQPLPDDFDCPEDEPGDLTDLELLNLEQSLLGELGSHPKVGRELKTIAKGVLREGLTRTEIIKQVGRSRYYNVIRPALVETLGWLFEDDCEGEGVDGE